MIDAVGLSLPNRPHHRKLAAWLVVLLLHAALIWLGPTQHRPVLTAAPGSALTYVLMAEEPRPTAVHDSRFNTVRLTGWKKFDRALREAERPPCFEPADTRAEQLDPFNLPPPKFRRCKKPL